MTSKSSFLVSMKENNKRRLWVWVVSALAFVLFLPLFVALRLSEINQSARWLVENYGAAAAEKIVRERLLEMVRNLLGNSEVLAVFTVVIAIACAVQGFSWLYSRKKIDFYMGMPVKRSRRFLVIWINGILIYLIPYLLGTGISMLVAAGSHALDGAVVKTIVWAALLNLLLYLCVYHMAILAVMLTGNVVITGMGFMVFALYEWLVRRANYTYQARFFRYFSSYSHSDEMKLSPFSLYANVMYASNTAEQAKGIAGLLLFAVICGALSYLSYRKRPAEGAGRAMVFEFTKPIVKILLVVPMALVMGDLVASDVDYSPALSLNGAGYVLLTLALVTVLGCALIQVIYEFDIKGALHKKRHILISGVLVALIFVCYRYDLLRYDEYVPNPEKVESAAFYPMELDTYDYMGMWIDEERKSLGGIEYTDRYMYLTDVEELCELVAYSMENYNAVCERFGKNSEESLETDDYWRYAVVIYRLKSGREVQRNVCFNLNDEKTTEYMDRIIGSEEFKEGYLMGASDRLSQIVRDTDPGKIKAYYGNEVYQQRMSQEELLELLACYKSDMQYYNFTSVKNHAPVGAVSLEFEQERNVAAGYVSTTQMGINIYPFFENSVACLKKFGYYMENR